MKLMSKYNGPCEHIQDLNGDLHQVDAGECSIGITTNCPSKVMIVDLETGKVYKRYSNWGKESIQELGYKHKRRLIRALKRSIRIEKTMTRYKRSS